MFVLCSLLLLSAAPDADPTVHAPPPCRTPAELHALCTGQRGWPDPLYDSSEAEFLTFIDGTIDAFTRDPKHEQDWLDGFKLLLGEMAWVFKRADPAGFPAARHRLAQAIVEGYDSDPPRSRERAARAMLEHDTRGAVSEVVVPRIAKDLYHPDPARASWAAKVLRVLLQDNLWYEGERMVIINERVSLLTEHNTPNQPYEYQNNLYKLAPIVDASLRNDPAMAAQLASLGFTHNSLDAIWLMGLLPPVRAAEALEPFLCTAHDVMQLQFAVAVLTKDDWRQAFSTYSPRLTQIVNDCGIEILTFLANAAKSNDHTYAPATLPLLNAFYGEHPDDLRDWLSWQLGSPETLPGTKEDLALWMLGDQQRPFFYMAEDRDTGLLRQLAERIETENNDSVVRPYAAVALYRIDRARGLPYVKECAAYIQQHPNKARWRSQINDKLAVCLAKSGTLDDMKLVTARNGTFEDGRSHALFFLGKLAVTTNTEAAWLHYVDVAGQTMTDLEVSDIYSWQHEVKIWPSIQAKEAYYGLLRKLFENPAYRQNTVNAMLNFRSSKHQPELLALFEGSSPELRASILDTLAQSGHHEVPQLLHSLRTNSNDPAIKAQIEDTLKKMRTGTAFQAVPDTPPTPTGPFALIPEFIAMGFVILGGGMILRRLRHRRTGRLTTQNQV